MREIFLSNSDPSPNHPSEDQFLLHSSFMFMDLVNAFLNIFAPIFTATTFFVFFPPYLCFKSLHFFWRSIFSENVAGKVVVIAGASSGMGEHIAYEYGKRGALLVIGARRENALREVAEEAYLVGSPAAIPCAH
ncbi:UNVERIFIED_CONTAM: 11-beta-hydroxysteroid dehydrogenase 1A [Sesamum latifolium]|uniref:11-beta-hydroxysteroid dehydrogenase 1A n=1 Tax=Sesamum latifolium TaxID=2727402 RepID=A0AAW2UE46_9LAMI